MKKLLFMLSLAFLVLSTNYAQVITDEIDIIKEMAQEEQAIIEAIVLYPKDIRTHIFEASTYPQVILKLSYIQKKTSSQYKELMMIYPMEVQKSVWEMTRYPGLISQLANNPGKVDEIIAKQPQDIQEIAHTLFRDHISLLQEIAQLEALSYSAFNRVIESLPSTGKTVFEKLIQYPEILGLLNENIEFTILGGDLYKKYPDWTEHYADSLNLLIARQQALELEDWKTQLENDPQAMEELKQATNEFASEYGYDNKTVEEEEQEVIDDIYYVDDEYEYDNEEYDYQEVEYRTVYRYHYPYWFGYPYWYSYPQWRPYPFWYEWGFYWNSYGGIHVYHMPSPFFMHWYFYQPHHHYHYAHLSHHFVDHYYGHRTSRSSVVGTVHTWRQANREVITDNWVATEKPERIKTLKEFGQMEKARVTYNEKNPRNPVTKKEYVKANKGRYPTLDGTVSPKEKVIPPVSKPGIESKKPTKPRVNPIPQKPDKRTNPKVKVDPFPKKPKVSPKPKTKINPVPKQPTRRKTNKSVEIKKARDYHNQTWKAPKTNTPVYKKSTPKPKPPVVKQKPRTKPRKPN